jgi:hypothetical protein
LALAVLIALIFSKFIFLVSFSSYYTFCLIETFHIPTGQAQLHLFCYLAAGAAGTFLGGPLGDRIGRKRVIWLSILGVLPISLALPHLGVGGTAVAAALAGLFFGLAFGIAAPGAAAPGLVADARGIGFVHRLCAWLPAIGILAAFMPDLRNRGNQALVQARPMRGPAGRRAKQGRERNPPQGFRLKSCAMRICRPGAESPMVFLRTACPGPFHTRVVLGSTWGGGGVRRGAGSPISVQTPAMPNTNPMIVQPTTAMTPSSTDSL